tara:strand:- start:639 stop:818 length:180 start_codon:yes stop_codon:yes gene_type:complete
MKKEYSVNITYEDSDDRCEIEESTGEEEIVFTIDNKDIICSREMSDMIIELDSYILGLA